MSDMTPQPATAGYSPWSNRVRASLVRGCVALVPASIAIVLAQIAGILQFLLIIGWGLSVTVAVRLYIQRGRLGYDVGDRVIGQTLVRNADRRPFKSGTTVFVRNVVHLLDALPFAIGFLWPLWDTRRQTFADKIMGHVVITAGPEPRHDTEALIKNAYRIWTSVIKRPPDPR